MRWQRIWERQAEQQEALGESPEGMTNREKGAAAKDLLLGMHEEVTQLSQETSNYKAHILKAEPVDRSNVIEKTVDVVKYAIAIAQLYGVTAEETHAQFMAKSDVVASKADGERATMEKNTKVFITDMDGCIADLTILDEMLEQISGTPEEKLKKNEELKTDFRATGGFADLPAVPGAPEALREIKKLGYKLVVITARPHHRHKRLYADTLTWMDNHNIKADLILFERDKAEAICKYVYPANPSFFVEDRVKHALEIAAIGVPVLLIENSKNKDIRLGKKIHRVTGWSDITRQLVENNTKENY